MYFKEEVRIAIRSQLVVGVLGSRRNQLNVLFVASVCLGSQLNNVVQRNVDEGAFFDFQIHKISQPEDRCETPIPLIHIWVLTSIATQLDEIRLTHRIADVQFGLFKS